MKSVSAARRNTTRRNPQANIQWRRLKDNFDEVVARTTKSPEMGSVITRWVLFGHLTKGQGYAARLVGEIVGRHERMWNAHNLPRTSGSPSFQRGTAGAMDDIARAEREGTIEDFERKAKRAKKRYTRLMAMLDKYPGAQEVLFKVCVFDEEIAADMRGNLASLLTTIGMEFGLIGDTGRSKRRHVYRS